MQDECPKDPVPDDGPEISATNELLLLLASAIWGFAFVAQRVAMEHIGPFTFNAIRFAIGSLPVIPLAVVSRRRASAVGSRPARALPPGASTDASRPAGTSPAPSARTLLKSALLVGGALYAGASLQQVGLVYTTAGKAGFITGLYVILTPILGLLWRMRPARAVWIGAALGVTGLYLLSVNERLGVNIGDVLVFAGAFFWAAHVIGVGFFIRRTGVGLLALSQFLTCALLSFVTALAVEEIRLDGIVAAAVPILYAGLVSVGVAYTLQLVGQRKTPPAHAAIILGMEAVFAALGGWIVLHETLSGRALAGCALVLSGVLVSQLAQVRRGVRKLKLTRVRPVP